MSAKRLGWMLCCLLLYRPVAAAELLELFPEPGQVMRDVQRNDPVETAIWQLNALDTLSILAEQAVPRGGDGRITAATQRVLDAYWRERFVAIERGEAAMRAGSSGGAEQDASRAFEARMQAFAPGTDFADLIFGKLLPPAARRQLAKEEQELRAGLIVRQQADHAAGLHARIAAIGGRPWSGADYGAAIQLWALEAVSSLPPAWQPHAMRVLQIPAPIWLALLVAWLLGGIWRARRFGMDATRPDTFLSGPRRYRLSTGVGRVVDVHARTTVTETTTYTNHRDGFGNVQHVPSTSYSTTDRQRIHVQGADGSERAVTTTNFELPVRAGHQLLDVAAFKGRAKQAPWVFYHIYDMQQTLYRAELRDMVRMRPRAFIPFVVLAA